MMEEFNHAHPHDTVTPALRISEAARLKKIVPPVVSTVGRLLLFALAFVQASTRPAMNSATERLHVIGGEGNMQLGGCS